MDEKSRQATRLWTLAQPKVAAFIATVVRDFRDRDDVLQDVAVAVIDSFESYDADRSFDAWALGVARNQVGTYLRKRRRHCQLFDEATTEAIEAGFASVSNNEPRVLDFLQDCVKHLDEHGQRLCRLRYHEDMKPAAIAESLNLAGTAVRKSLQRVREQLRSCVDSKASVEGLR